MKQTIKQRLIDYINYKRIGQGKFEKSVGFSNGYINNIKGTFGADKLEKIFGIYTDLDREWLLTGRGNMIKESSTRIETNGELIQLSEEEAPYGVNERSLKFRPHIESATGSCGAPNGFNQAIMEHECESISLPFMVNYDFSIRAAGDSMINRENPKRSIRNKDVIACRYWTSRSHIRWGEVYALATRDGIVIKKIMPSEKEGCIKCVSFNESDGFIPYDLDLEEVTDWAIVVGVVSIEAW